MATKRTAPTVAERAELEKREGARDVYRGVFERFGSKQGFRGTQETLLLRNIVDADGQPVCDNLWFNLTTAFAALHLQFGDTVEFRARSEPVVKSEIRWKGVDTPKIRVDYRLTRPTKVRKVLASEPITPPDDQTNS